jgi:hypothetical protein
MAWLVGGHESADVMFDDLGRRKTDFALTRCLGYTPVTGYCIFANSVCDLRLG